jgi:hypothetical protein
MTHDLYQAYAMLGAYPAVPALQPFSGPQNYGQYGGINPLAQQLMLSSILAGQTNPQLQGVNPFQGGIQNNPFGGFQQNNPLGGFQQNPLAGLYQNALGIQQNPFAGLHQNPLGIQQNPWIPVQNPLIAATLHNPMLHPLLAQTIGGQLPYQQGYAGTPFGQTGYPLAPQSWIGQGVQQPQIHPLYQQLAARALTQGIHPLAAY